MLVCAILCTFFHDKSGLILRMVIFMCPIKSINYCVAYSTSKHLHEIISAICDTPIVHVFARACSCYRARPFASQDETKQR